MTTAPRTPEDAVLEIAGLRVWYAARRGPVRAVDGIDLVVRPGETVGVVGESGSGKSTLGRGIMGLVPAGAAVDGSVRLDGVELTGLSTKRLRRMRGPELGLVFQEPMTRLNPLMRVADHFREALRTHEPKIKDEEIRRRSLASLASVGIPPTRFDQFPHEFSGGMRQRIMIALTLVLKPRLVVADEPTTALDVLVEAQILEVLADLKRTVGTALVFITHNLGIVAEACDRVAVMYAGRIVEQGLTADVFGSPAHPYTRELLRSIIGLHTTELHSIPGSPPDLIEPPSGCRFHPRCPNAMVVCPQKFPRNIGLPDGRRVECWLHGPEAEIPPGGREPMPHRQEVAVADEA